VPLVNTAALKDLKPALYTGSESPTQKEESKKDAHRKPR
jgi:hypothetical protein